MTSKLLLIAPIVFAGINSYSQQVIDLYQTVPNAVASAIVTEKSDTTTNNRIRTSQVVWPTLTAFFPEKNKSNGTAVIICPGGGYSYLVINREGTDVAEAFAKKGVAAFVLKYRLPNDKIMNDKSIGPLQDAEQAIKIVRDRAGEWNIDTSRVGIIGFSAGGHLASTASTHFNEVVIDNKENSNLRPDFSILVYPVISFSDSLAHKGSRKNLLGDTPSINQVHRFSNERQVSAKTPPAFLIHCGDDKVVSVGNSIKYYESLLRNGVKAELHIYPTGGHGFALNNSTVTDQWLDRCFNWMTSNKWLKRE
ncbi:MAG: alpha/beta hydrolase [Ferruginibacter sp.]